MQHNKLMEMLNSVKANFSIFIRSIFNNRIVLNFIVFDLTFKMGKYLYSIFTISSLSSCRGTWWISHWHE